MRKLRAEFLYDPDEKSVLRSDEPRKTCPKCGNDDNRYFREVEVVDDSGEPLEDAWMCLDCGCINLSSELVA